MLKKSFFVIVSILLAAFTSHAQTPQLINYQGFLRNASGDPVTGSLSIEFRIYKTPTGGTTLWTETPTVTINDGIFNVLLGATVPIPYSVFEGGKRYLALKIGSDPEMVPRKRFVSVGYAFHSSNSDSLGGFESSSFVKIDQPNSISTAMLQDNGVTKRKILPDIVSSVSGVKNDGGNIDLVAGSNVTITADDANNRITISSSGGSGGDITAVNAGTGLNGGGTSGNVTLNVDVPLHLSGSASGVIKGTHSNSGANGSLGNANYGVFGSKGNGSYGVYGTTNNGSTYGYLGGGSYGVYGFSGSGVYGYLGGSVIGAYGKYGGNYGSLGNASYGVFGSGNSSSYGVYGKNGSNYGTLGSGSDGVLGSSSNNTGSGVAGIHTGSGNGVYGRSNNGYAGNFSGNVNVSGSFYAGMKYFKIDHPLDPANKYLYHFSLESNEPANVYSGNVTLDDNGEATVRLPDWFGALNKEFRYQLTCIGGFAQVYIADEISDNQFRIAGGTPGMKVSWQVTGIRHDAFAKVHRVHVETEKTGKERGKYLHPVEHGVSETLGIDYEIIQRMQAEQKEMEE